MKNGSIPSTWTEVLEQVRDRGPLRTADLHDPGQGDGSSMWGWSKGKIALEALFMGGQGHDGASHQFHPACTT